VANGIIKQPYNLRTAYDITIPGYKNSNGAFVVFFPVFVPKTPVINAVRKVGDVVVTSDFHIEYCSEGSIYIYTWSTNYTDGQVLVINFSLQ